MRARGARLRAPTLGMTRAASCLLWFLVLAGVLAPPTARAYTLEQLLESRLNPALSYRTLETEHFWLHYPAELEALAGELARTAEQAHTRVTSALGTEPQGRTHLVLAHRADQPETFTFVFPHRQIFLDVSLPHLIMGLNDYADWNEWLVTHEYSHIVHLDALSGPARALAPLLGSWLRPNMTAPAWVKEGIAVYLESTLTPRGHSRLPSHSLMTSCTSSERAA